MMARVLSSQLPRCAGQPVFLQGWVHRLRDLGAVRFLVLRDRDGMSQVVVPENIDISTLGCECVVGVSGACRLEERAPAGVEVLAERVELISRAQPPPLEVFNPHAADKNRLETLLDHRAISLRVPDVVDIFRVQAVVLEAFRAHLRGRGFTEIASPKIVQAGAEGGSAIFKVEYYEQAAYLAQSPQFYKQMMVGSGLERVFEVGHAYRAEKSETSRHLTEYVSLDFEMGFIQSEQDVMAMHSGLMAAIFEAVRQQCGAILQRRGVQLPEFAEIPQVSFPEACQILRERFGKDLSRAGDLDTEGERLIGQWALNELRSELLFVTGYHVPNRPMYAMSSDQPPLTRTFDLLYKGIEITTGGQRIHDYGQLVRSIESRGLDPADYEGYLECFLHGMCPHGGMGMGLERLVMQMLALSNVKEASLFPRDRRRLRP